MNSPCRCVFLDVYWYCASAAVACTYTVSLTLQCVILRYRCAIQNVTECLEPTCITNEHQYHPLELSRTDESRCDRHVCVRRCEWIQVSSSTVTSSFEYGAHHQHSQQCAARLSKSILWTCWLVMERRTVEKNIDTWTWYKVSLNLHSSCVLLLSCLYVTQFAYGNKMVGIGYLRAITGSSNHCDWRQRSSKHVFSMWMPSPGDSDLIKISDHYGNVVVRTHCSRNSKQTHWVHCKFKLTGTSISTLYCRHEYLRCCTWGSTLTLISFYKLWQKYLKSAHTLRILRHNGIHKYKSGKQVLNAEMDALAQLNWIIPPSPLTTCTDILEVCMKTKELFEKDLWLSSH